MYKIKSESEDLDKYDNLSGDFWYYKKNTTLFHNPYGPAIIHRDGRIDYFIEHKLHRLDGPAVIFSDGAEAYFINDEQLNKEEFEKHPERLKYLGKEHLICLI